MHTSGSSVELISVVIPTCNRKSALLALLDSLDRSVYPLLEVIIIDAGDDRLAPSDYDAFTNLNIQYRDSERSVCIQRNLGIRLARSPWIFLCDDDVEMPSDYLQLLTEHIHTHQEAGAVCGLFLQKEGDQWKGSYPLRSARALAWKYIFRLGFWGEIEYQGSNRLIQKIKKHYREKGNYIASSGWPVLTDFSGDYFLSPIYTLGAALVKKDWLLYSPFDEALDAHGIGDNYGVCIGFPGNGMHILTHAFVYHHQAPVNRLKRPLQYFRRMLALDYFMTAPPRNTHAKEKLRHTRRSRLLWSLTGNLLTFLLARDTGMVRASFRCIRTIALGRNPYSRAAMNKERVTEPQ